MFNYQQFRKSESYINKAEVMYTKAQKGPSLMTMICNTIVEILVKLVGL